MKRAVFLDRDGVLTDSEIRDGRPYAPRSIEEFRLLEGAAEAVQSLDKAGFTLVVATNQPDLRTGLLEPEVLAEMHRCLREWLPLDAIQFCGHVDADDCACRKPKPGLLLEAARDLQLDLPRSYMVGDRWRDVSAGKAAGCTTVFIDYGYSEELRDKPDFTVRSVLEAARVILEHSGKV